MVPMRDGIHLQTAIFAPLDQTEPLPILLLRSPYGIPENDRNLQRSPGFKELVQDGYIFVFQNLRGRFKSEGTFNMSSAPEDKSNPKSTSEGTDAYDTIDWLVKNVPKNNGKVGIFGVSYSGLTAALSLLDPHPALKAISEQASPADQWMNDDFHRFGAFRLSYGFEYSVMEQADKNANTHFKFDTYDTYDWYLRLGPLSNANGTYLHGQIPAWNDFIEHPDYDSFWKKELFTNAFHGATVPILNVAGWWDQEDPWGPWKIYSTLAKNDPSHNNLIVAGPWNHGGWRGKDGLTLGLIPFGDHKTSIEFDGLICNKKTVLNGSTFDAGSQVAGLLERGEEAAEGEMDVGMRSYIPADCQRILMRHGAIFPTETAPKPAKAVPKEKRQALDTSLRIFSRNSGATENVMKMKLGARYGIFRAKVLPVLVTHKVIINTEYRGAGQPQERYELNYPVETILRAEDPSASLVPNELRGFWDELRS